ncbi:MAG: protein kinase [Kofleriaceae bacterium]|nr:protein kinase [Kofleriaceae bacterium]
MPAAQRIGKYEVVAHLAAGGMGQVYLGKVVGPGGFERHCVVKTLDATSIEGDDAVAMFLDEARLVGSLHHQHIGQVVEVDRDADGRYFLVMEYVHGETAEHVLDAAAKADHILPLGFGLSVVSALAAALHYAHERCGSDGRPLQIVHRDVSPSNVMVGYDGGIKLIDFGIAKATDRSSRTQAGFIKGKIGYMAPEQLLSRPLDRRTDVFALGIVLYELTTTARAFKEPSELETMQRLRDGVFKPPGQLVRGYPEDLARVVETALAVNVNRRYQSAAQLGAAVEAVAARLGLVLGEAAVVETMTNLFGRRPEPWIVERADSIPEIVEEAATRPLAMAPEASGITLEASLGELDALMAQVRGEDLFDGRPRAASVTQPDAAPAAGERQEAVTVTAVPGYEAQLEARIEAERRQRRAAAGEVSSGEHASVVVAADTGAGGSTKPAPLPARPSGAQPAVSAAVPPARSSAAMPAVPPARSSAAMPAARSSAAMPAASAPAASGGSTSPAPTRPRPAATALVARPDPATAAEPQAYAGAGWKRGLLAAVLVFAGVLAGLWWWSQRQRTTPVAGDGPVAGATSDAAALTAPRVDASQVATRPAAQGDASDVPTSQDLAVATDAAVAADPAVPDGGATVAPATDLVWLRIETNPDDATVLLDGVRLGHTPFAQQVARGGAATVKLRRRGHKSRRVPVDLSADVTLSVSLSGSDGDGAGSDGSGAEPDPEPAPAP